MKYSNIFLVLLIFIQLTIIVKAELYATAFTEVTPDLNGW